MSRILKFRAFNKRNKKMYDVFSFCDKIIKIIVGIGTAIKTPIEDFEPLMQFTGLTDKNGKEIYEGDIISLHSPCINKSLPWKPATIKRVGWHKSGCWNLFLTNTDEHKGFTGILLSNLQYCTVIGNIHENPELL